MRTDNQKYSAFTRRSLIVGGIKLLLISIIGSRYYYLQVLKSDRYSTLSDKNRIRFIVLSPYRGKILDKNNIEIATNTANFKLGVDPLSITNLPAILEKIKTTGGVTINLTKDEIKKLIRKRNPNDFLIIKENASWQEAVKIYEHDYELEGVEVVNATHRHYTYGEAFAHITGYISSISKYDIEKAPELALPNSSQLKIGKMGIEKTQDSILLGQPGYKRTEVDFKGKYVRTISIDLPQPGEDVKLTIDARLQEFLHQLMITRGISGAIIVLDLKHSGVLALHSTPSFNPNEFVDGVSASYWNTLLKDANHPLINNAVSTPYPPGSTFKPVTALAALEAGIDPKRKIFCSGGYKLGNRIFKCWKTTGHGNIDLTDAIAGSCNPFFFVVASQIGFEKVAQVARLLGLGAKTNIELSSENNGLIPDKAWKKKRYKMEWYPGDTLNASIGQGYVLTTPLQIATATARIATGKLITPKLLTPTDTPIPPENLAVNQQNLELVKTGMRMHVNTPNGLVFKHHMSIGDFIISGKTGTAQVVDLKLQNLGHKFKHHALFTSFAPYDDPKYVVSVVVEHGEAGGRTAAPLAKAVYHKIIELYGP